MGTLTDLVTVRPKDSITRAELKEAIGRLDTELAPVRHQVAALNLVLGQVQAKQAKQTSATRWMVNTPTRRRRRS
jgi:hypothetical protein